MAAGKTFGKETARQSGSLGRQGEGVGIFDMEMSRAGG